ncbi:hypothetical protein DVH05_000359 [Phytophthora capsici]|nr:hypothetical protein DVH05_000359 [Phytophthora capsici]
MQAKRHNVSSSLDEAQYRSKNLPSWLKRKREIEALRQQTQALETRVACLEMKKSSGANLQSSEKEEKRKCIAAQNENEKLKTQLLQYAKQFERLKQVMAQEQECLPQQGQIHTPVFSDDELLEVVGRLWGDKSTPFSPLALSTLSDQEPDNENFQLDEDLEVKTRKPKKKRRRDRNRPWHELARLQLESDNLEQELQIQLAHASKEAKEALHERNKNAQLKTILKESVQDVHQLEQDASRLLSELVGIIPSSPAMATRVLPLDTTDKSIFRSMAHSVDDQYKDMSRVLRAEFDGLSSEMVESFVSRTASVYTGNKDSEILKFRARIVTPFTKSTLERALWGVLEGEGGVAFEPSQDACELVFPVVFFTDSQFLTSVLCRLSRLDHPAL